MEIFQGAEYHLMPFSLFKKWFPPKIAPPPGAPVTVREGRPWLLLITSQKRNQNYYRDLELARRFSTIWLSEYFPFADFGHDLCRIMAHLAPAHHGAAERYCRPSATNLAG